MKKKLNIFTAYYPSSKFEVYLDNELPHADEYFDEYQFFPNAWGEETRKLKPNQKVYHFNSINKISIYIILKYIDQIIKLLFLEIKDRGIKTVFKNRSYILRYLFLQLQKFDELRNILKNRKYEVYYSNWSVDNSLCLSLLKEYGIIDNFVMRAHRYDLYDEEYPLGFIPFRKYQQNLVSWIGSISDDGCKYLEKNYPELKNKISLFRLGTNDLGVSPVNKEDVVRIVTCSNIKKVKRLHLIVASLKLSKQKIEWHHFGDGDLKDEIFKLCQELPSNILVHFHGRILSEELYAFYRTHSITCFINVSASEGIPVSIMEAVSFGIPVIATNVGGTSEIINELTGVLLDANFNPSELTDILNNIQQSKLVESQFRQGVRNYWQHNFNANICFPQFIKKLANDNGKLA